MTQFLCDVKRLRNKLGWIRSKWTYWNCNFFSSESEEEGFQGWDGGGVAIILSEQVYLLLKLNFKSDLSLLLLHDSKFVWPLYMNTPDVFVRIYACKGEGRRRALKFWSHTKLIKRTSPTRLPKTLFTLVRN